MTSRIVAVTGRRVWDSRARPTVEAEVHLSGGAVGRAIAPSGASTGRREAACLRDADGFGVDRAVAGVRGPLAAAVAGIDAADQEAVDAALAAADGTADLSQLGANACISVSMAAAHAAAAAAGVPLWRLLDAEACTLPLPEIQIFGGGAHAGRRIDIQDLMVVCPGAGSFGQALDWTAQVYRAAGALMEEAGALAGVADEGGWWPAFGSNEEALATLTRAVERAGFAPGAGQVGIALDLAASQFGRGGRYRLGLDGRDLDRDGWIAVLLDWIGRYPVLSVEDPLAEDDADGWAAFAAAAPPVQIVGDDLLASDAGRVAAAAGAGVVSAALLKPDQRGTLTQTRRAREAARAAGLTAIVSARSGESEDTTVMHLAVGWGADQLKVGAMARSERGAKWNEGLRIAAALGERARFAGGRGLRRAAQGETR